MKHEYANPYKDHEPSHYHFRIDGTALEIDIHESQDPSQERWEHRHRNRPDTLKQVQERFKLSEPFIFPTADSEYFGFGPVFAQAGEEGGFVTYKTELPDFRGRSGEFDWDRIYPYVVTFNLLLEVLRYDFDGKSTSPLPQHVWIKPGMSTERRMHAFPLSADITPAMTKWIVNNLQRESLPEVQNTMYEAYKRMWGGSEYDVWSKDGFACRLVEPKWLHLWVPGDACDLGPDDMGMGGVHDQERGYGMGSHNLDSPIQQLTLMFGLAKAEELAMNDYRRARKKGV